MTGRRQLLNQLGLRYDFFFKFKLRMLIYWTPSHSELGDFQNFECFGIFATGISYCSPQYGSHQGALFDIQGRGKSIKPVIF